jgi:hypothetical protein
MVSAATQMSHTSSLFALALLLYSVERVASGQHDLRLAAWVATSACLAFWIRPATALGFGAPLVLSWLSTLRKVRGANGHVLVFAGAALLPALLFLWVNAELTGSPWRTGYHAAAEHAAATQFRFTSYNGSQVDSGSFLHFFVETGPAEILARYGVLGMRLWTDSWGFPIGLSLALLATRGGMVRLLGPFVGLLVAYVPIPDAGIDTFGPVHFTELMIPLTLWSTDGLRRVHAWASAARTPCAAPALLIAAVACSVTFYWVPRFSTLSALTSDIRASLDVLQQAPPGSVVFTSVPFAPPCRGRPGRHFVFFRPDNDPDLRNPRIWANHIDLDSDRRLLASMPGRRGFLIRHDETACRSTLVPIEDATAEAFPASVRLLPGDLGETPRHR